MGVMEYSQAALQEGLSSTLEESKWPLAQPPVKTSLPCTAELPRRLPRRLLLCVSVPLYILLVCVMLVVGLGLGLLLGLYDILIQDLHTYLYTAASGLEVKRRGLYKLSVNAKHMASRQWRLMDGIYHLYSVSVSSHLRLVPLVIIIPRSHLVLKKLITSFHPPYATGSVARRISFHYSTFLLLLCQTMQDHPLVRRWPLVRVAADAMACVSILWSYAWFYVGRYEACPSRDTHLCRRVTVRVVWPSDG